jgi:hypothetical protein
MINLLNNHLKFKEKMLSLHKDSDLNPQNFNNVLKTKIKTLYKFSYNLNKFSKNNPTLVFKGLPFLTKGFSIKQTENFLKLSPLSLKGLETLKIMPSQSLSGSALPLRDTFGSNGRPNSLKVRELHSQKKNLTCPNSKFSNLISPFITHCPLPGSAANYVTDVKTKGIKSVVVPAFRSPQMDKRVWSGGWLCPSTCLNRSNLNSKTVITARSLSNLSQSHNPNIVVSENIKETNLNKGKFRSSSNPKNLSKKGGANVSLTNWKANWSQKKTQYSNLGVYKPQVSDKNWFSFLDQVRQIIKSKYAFNAFLSSSQSVNYNFNKDFKKVDLNSIYKILKYFFTSLSSLISKPVFLFSPDKINIRLFYFIIPSFPKLKKERKVKKFIRNKGQLYEEKKNKREFRNIMNKFKMKLFIARWKESNDLIRIPSFPDNSNQFIFTSNQYTKVGILSDKNTSPIQSFTALLPSPGSASYDIALKVKGGEQNQPFPCLPALRGGSGGQAEPQSHQSQIGSGSVKTMVSLNKDKLKYLVFILEKTFNKTVILDLVRLKYPYHDSNILSQVLGLSSKRKNFRKMMRKLLYTATIKNPTKMIRKQNFSIIPSYLSGIKIRLAGRLITQRVVPRFTVQSVQMGSLARGKVNYIDSSRFTHKNKRGAFSFTVTTSHIFENYK